MGKCIPVRQDREERRDPAGVVQLPGDRQSTLTFAPKGMIELSNNTLKKK
jgi:hypothetical protein